MQELKFLKFIEFFIKNPYDEVYLRQLAKQLKINPFATKKYADFAVKEKVIIEEKKANLRYLKANMNNIFYKYLKISYNLRELTKSDFVEFIKNNTPNLSSIVLFGSIARGEDSEESDIDILVIGNKKNISFHDYKKKLNREINLHFFSWREWNEKAKEDNPFYYEVINKGIALYGELPIVKWK